MPKIQWDSNPHCPYAIKLWDTFTFTFLLIVFGIIILTNFHMGWSGGVKMLGKIPVPGHPTNSIIVGQGPIALAVGVGGVV